ncbi:MAG: transporter [Clostridiales bacterium]|nr:transporter [Clostridiales bacterium]
MTEKRLGTKTFIWAIIMSAPSPLVVGLGLLVGRSSTQIADFVRKSAELFAIIISFIVFLRTQKYVERDEMRKQTLERRANIFVGLMMLFAGIIMLILTFLISHTDKGNVIPALAIIVFGGTVNSIFWIRYTRLNKTQPNSIFAVQIRLYRAKTLVDMSVIIALLSVLIAPQSVVSYWIDFIGSIIVSLYIIWSGTRTVYKQIKPLQKNG